MTIPGFLRVQSDGLYLAVKLQPRAKRDEIGEALGNELKIQVTAPPVDSAANEALLRLLAETLDSPRGAVRLARGHTSRHKLVKLQGLTPAEALAKLRPVPDAAVKMG